MKDDKTNTTFETASFYLFQFLKNCIKSAIKLFRWRKYNIPVIYRAMIALDI